MKSFVVQIGCLKGIKRERVEKGGLRCVCSVFDVGLNDGQALLGVQAAEGVHHESGEHIGNDERRQDSITHSSMINIDRRENAHLVDVCPIVWPSK